MAVHGRVAYQLVPVKSIINNKLIAMQTSTNCKYSRIAFISVSCGCWPSLAVVD
jgi:hypothetical protein